MAHEAAGYTCHPSSQAHRGLSETTRGPGLIPTPRLALSQSPPYSSGSYDSIKTEVSGCPEDLTVGRAPTADDDDDDHDDHEDNDKMNDSEGMDPERLKAFNVSASKGWVGWAWQPGPALSTACLSHRCLYVSLWTRT